MRSVSFLFGTIAAAGVFAFIGVGCGGDGGGTGGGGASSSSSSSSSSGSSSSSSGSTSSSSSSSGSAVTLDCASYCGEVMTNCTAANAQFSDMAGCMGSCAAFPPGALTDMSGDTLGCRIYHGGVAGKDAASAAMHCPHAGPTGGDKDPTDAAGGPCGEGCESFCNIATKVCATTFTDNTACMTACKGFAADTADYSTADTSKNDFGCRMYHLTVASSSATAATMHCPHIVAASPVCIN